MCHFQALTNATQQNTNGRATMKTAVQHLIHVERDKVAANLMNNVEGGILFVHPVQLVVEPISKQRRAKNVVILKVITIRQSNI